MYLTNVRHIAADTLNVLKYHGQRREVSVADLLDYDIVLSTYATVSSDFKRESGLLHAVSWFRLILDEGNRSALGVLLIFAKYRIAHSIRHKQTKQYRAISTLGASHRWCLSGTPIQNSLLDLESLLRFLRVPHFEKSHGFRETIMKPIEDGRAVGFNKLRLLLKSVCLRRTKHLLHLPEPNEVYYELELSSEEKALYHEIGENSKRAINEVVSGRKEAVAFGGILQCIGQLRMLCNHGTIDAVSRQSPSSDFSEDFALLQETRSAICISCSKDIHSVDEDSPNRGHFTACLHLLCNDCFIRYERRIQEESPEPSNLCPICNKYLPSPQSATQDQDMQIDLINSNEARTAQCTKLNALLQDILQVYSTSKRYGLNEH